MKIKMKKKGIISLAVATMMTLSLAAGNLSVLHAQEGAAKQGKQTEKQAEKQVSTYAVSDFLQTLQTAGFQQTDGVWKSSKNSLTYQLNEKKDSFLNTKWYNKNSELGIAGSFHIVAFNTANLSAHVNGNVLAQEVTGTANFGTKEIDDEVSYIQKYTQVRATSAAKNSQVLALGSDVTVGLTNNDNSFTINSVKLDSPNNLIQDEDTSTNPFVDFTRVKSEVTSLSAKLANKSETNVEKNIDASVDQNNRNIKLVDKNSAGYVHMTAQEFESLSGNDLKLYVGEKSDQGSIIVNVDCQGKSSITKTPQIKLYHGDTEVGNKEWNAESDGKNGDNYGKVIWNFYNCASGFEINQTATIHGTVIAQNATINIYHNVDGTIIAENVNVLGGETHRLDFTGTTDTKKEEGTTTETATTEVTTTEATTTETTTTEATTTETTTTEATSEEGTTTEGTTTEATTTEATTTEATTTATEEHTATTATTEAGTESTEDEKVTVTTATTDTETTDTETTESTEDERVTVTTETSDTEETEVPVDEKETATTATTDRTTTSNNGKVARTGDDAQVGTLFVIAFLAGGIAIGVRKKTKE